MINLKKKLITVGNKKIGDGQPCFIVAELSGNHNQDIKKAYKLIDAAADAGVDAVKLQTYTPDTLTIDSNKKWFQISNNKKWGGQTLYELYKKTYTPWEWQPKLKAYGEEKGLIIFSTPFDISAVNFLETMHVQLYKISSFEINHLPLLKTVARTEKPVIISRGLASLVEIRNTIRILKSCGTPEIVVLHCISSYPATLDQMNLLTLVDIKQRFKVLSGLSDHSLGITATVTAVALGASVIEKHFTLSRKEGGSDASFSLEPFEMKELVKSIRETEKAIGKVTYTPDNREKEFKVYKPSIFVTMDLIPGDVLTEDNTRIIRPGFGLAPKYYSSILGKLVKKKIHAATPLTWKMIRS